MTGSGGGGEEARSLELAADYIGSCTFAESDLPFVNRICTMLRSRAEDLRALSPAEGFEEWHRRECARLHMENPKFLSAWNTEPCDPTDPDKWGDRAPERFRGRTCREVYESEHPAPGRAEEPPSAAGGGEVPDALSVIRLLLPRIVSRDGIAVKVGGYRLDVHCTSEIQADFVVENCRATMLREGHAEILNAAVKMKQPSDRDAALEEAARIARKPRIHDAMRGHIQVPDFGEEIAMEIEALKGKKP